MMVRAGWGHVCAVAVAVVLAVSSSGAGGAAAAASGAASVPVADDARPSRFVVKPGQSLNGIASAAIPSSDRAMRDRMAALLFDANPGAFMGSNPNRTSAGTGGPLPVWPFMAAGAAALVVVIVGLLISMARRRRRAAAAGVISAGGKGLTDDASRVTDAGAPVGGAPRDPAAMMPTPAGPQPTPTAGGQDMPLAPDFPADAAASLASLELSLPPLPSTPASAYDAVIVAAEHDAPVAPSPAVPPPRLGAAPFGASNLDLDLDFNVDLPPLAAQPSGIPTLGELAAIARNKLDLAVESMELGDVAGARALVSEVIASNEPTTQEQARELHAVLVPL